MASNSTKLITDMKSVISNGPQGNTVANSLAAAGPIMDYKGYCYSVLIGLEEISVLIAKVIQDTDSSDSANLTLLDGIQALVNGTSSPSTTAITDIKSVIARPPDAATIAKATAAAGPIMDYVGNLYLLKRKLEQCAIQIGFNSQASGAPKGSLLDVTDASGDSTNKNLLLGMSQVLV